MKNLIIGLLLVALFIQHGILNASYETGEEALALTSQVSNRFAELRIKAFSCLGENETLENKLMALEAICE